MHYQILVVLRKGESLEEVMEPFSEYKDVEDHEERCWCVGNKARADVNTIHNFIEKVRNVYDKLPEEKRTNSLWRKMVAEHRQKERELLLAHPDIDKADPSCSECEGRGLCSTTSNPDGHWDYFEEGGRWDGSLVNKRGKSVNRCKVKNLSLEQMELAVHRKLVEAWEKIQECLKSGDTGKLEYLYGYEGEKDFQTYSAKRKPDRISAYAYVADGEWVANEKWDRRLHMSSPVEDWQEGLDKIIAEADPEDELVIVDCHS